MTKKINKLTPDQEKMIDGLVQEWIGYGLSTSAAERDRAEEAMGRIYTQSGFKFPSLRIWTASPLDGCIVAATLAAGKEIDSYDPTPEEIRAQLNTCIYGQHEASWLAFYNAYQNLGVEGLDEIVPFQELGKSCGWVWPFDQAVVFCERPKQLAFDDNHDLHNEAGPAIWYPGKDDGKTVGQGMKIHAIHSMIVPDVLIEAPEKITVAMIKENTNTEVRRLLRQAYGNGRYLADIGAKVIDVDTVSVDIQERNAKTITRALMEDDEGNRWLVASDGSTDRVYSDLLAPPDCASCAEAYEAITGHKDSDIIAQG